MNDDIVEALQLPDRIKEFKFSNYLQSLGYKELYSIPIDDYMFVPPNRRKIPNALSKFKRVNNIHTLPNSMTRGYTLYKHIKPW
jgi:hypothetical protein